MVTKERIEQILAVTDVTERVKQMAEVATELGGTVEIVGKWVWASWNARPSVETRDLLKAGKFRWNAVRGIWQYAGVPRRRSNASNERLRAYYGARQVTTASGERFTVPTMAGLSPTHVNGSPIVRNERFPMRETVHSGEEI